LKKELVESKKRLEEMQAQKVQVAETLQKKEEEIAALNKDLEEVIEDLASVKESKCWIYTKPLRDIHRVLQGGKDR